MKPHLLLLILAMTLASASFVQPVHAQGFSVALTLGVINTSLSSIVTDTVTVTNLDVADHTVKLTAAASIYWSVTFAPSQVTVTAVDPEATATMTILVPAQNDFCPGENSAGPYFNTFTVTGRDTVSLLTSTSSLVVNVAALTSPVTANVDASDDSYALGDSAVLTMSSNYASKFTLTVRKPDGNTWTTMFGILPSTFTKTTTTPLGTYTAELTAYYCGTAFDSTRFQVTPNTYDVAVSVAGLPSGITTPLRVDGGTVTQMTGGDTHTMTFSIGTSHTFQIDEYVPGASGYRYCAASNSWTASGAGSNTFAYGTEVYLDASTNPQGVTTVTSPKWYAQGSSVAIADAPSEIVNGQGVKYVFAKWTVDGVARSGNGFTLTMDAPHTLVANYDTYYMLTIQSDYGSPEGQGYYRAGTTAVFSVTSPVSVNLGGQQIFVDWQGDYTGAEPQGSVTMNGPRQVAAVWTLSYTQLYVIVGTIASVAAIVSLAAFVWTRRRPPSVLTASPRTPRFPSPAETRPTAEAAAKPQTAPNCRNCGAELLEWHKFCPECGQRIEKANGDE